MLKIPSTVCDVTDLFAGGGGSSTGVKAHSDQGIALKYALNHDALSIMVHNNNHPEADHYLGDVKKTDPRNHPGTRILIASPSCTDFSQAKTHKTKVDLRQYPMFKDDAKKYEAAIAERQSRTTMWDVVRFTAVHKYDIVICENVWQVRKWEDYRAWWDAMTNLGYVGKVLYLNSMFFHSLNGVTNSPFSPQSRNRWYCVWRKKTIGPADLGFRPLAPCQKCDKPDVRAIQGWRNPHHQHGEWNRNYDYYCPDCGKVVIPYFYPAIWCIDFDIPIQQIGDPNRSRPISPNTKRRIKAGIRRHGLDPLNLDKSRGDKARSALWYGNYTLTRTNTQTMAFPPHIIDLSRINSKTNDTGQIRDATTNPEFTLTTAGTLGFVVTTKHSSNDAMDKFAVRPADQRENFTLTKNPSQGVILPAWLVELYGGGTLRSIEKAPLNTVTSGGGKSGLAMPPKSFIATYNGNSIYADIEDDCLPTITKVQRHGLAQVDLSNLDDLVESCYYRTLRPWPELVTAQGFPLDYDFTDVKKGRRLAGGKITKLIGQSVTPCVMEWLVGQVLRAIDDPCTSGNCLA